MSPLRAIIGARTSTINNDKVSHTVQLENGEKYAKDKGWEIVGTPFQDLGVSATVSPFDRPDLGPWLSDEKKDSYDVIIWSKVDRAFRSSFDCSAVTRWAQRNKKILVFTDDGLTLNYRDSSDAMAAMHAEMFVTMSAMFAQMELTRMTQRANDREAGLRFTDRFPKGVPPFGYRVIDHPSGSGKALERNPEQTAVLHDLAAKLISGWSLNALARHLNDTGIQSNVGRAMERETRWSVKNVTELFTSPKTQGIKTKDGKALMRPDGSYIRMASPTFDDDTWTQIQSAIAERSQSGKRRVHSTSPILGVGFCECGASLTPKSSRSKGVDYKYYRCGRTPNPCKGIGIKQSDAHETLEYVMTQTFGDLRATRRVFVPGSDNSAELESVRKAIARVATDADLGYYDDDEVGYRSRMDGLVARRTELLAVPVRAAGYENVQEEQTYAERWANADEEERREILVKAGIRLTLHRDDEPTLTPPDSVADLVGNRVPVSRLEADEWRAFLSAAVTTGITGEELFTDDSDSLTFIGDDESVLTVPAEFVDQLRNN